MFGTPPKTSAVRSVGIVPQITKKKTPVKTPVQEVKKQSSQDLLCDSPDILSMSIDVVSFLKCNKDYHHFTSKELKKIIVPIFMVKEKLIV